MINIGVVGCGDWASKIINEINRNNKFNLNSIVCRKRKEIIPGIKVFNSIEKMVDANITDSIYVAADPKLNLEIVKLLKNFKTPLILEKPICDSFKNIKILKEIIEKNKLLVFPNITNYFSETFVILKKLTDENYKDISEIIIYEGGVGPFRENIHPVWDWGFHSVSLLYLLFENQIFSNIETKKIKTNNLFGKGIVYKFTFKIDSNIKVKILTGNLFKKKLRKVKIKFKNNTFILNDMVQHKLYSNKKVIFENKNSPVTSLLNTFENALKFNKFETSRKLIDTAYKTTNFLETFFKC